MSIKSVALWLALHGILRRRMCAFVMNGSFRLLRRGSPRPSLLAKLGNWIFWRRYSWRRKRASRQADRLIDRQYDRRIV